jgi:tRNA(His) 5'-end guanylyltransferase
MSFEYFVIVALLVGTGVREYFFWRETQKLINKLMSRNYYDYQYNERVKQEEQAQSGEMRIPVEDVQESEVGHILSTIV